MAVSFETRRRSMATESLVAQAALRGERLVCLCRIPFCLAVIARFLSLEPSRDLRAAALNAGAIIVAIGFSLVALGRIQRENAHPRLLRCSVVLDVTICCVSLLETVLWPGRGEYVGLLRRPDIALVLVVVFASGLRLSPRLSTASGLTAAFGCAALLTVERRLHTHLLVHQPHELTLFAVALAAATALSVVIATRTLSLVHATAEAATKIDRARQDYVALLRDQHDARNMLSAAMTHAELAQRAWQARDLAGASAADLSLRRVRDNLGAAGVLVQALGERAFAHRAALCALEPVELGRLIPSVAEVLARRYPNVQIDLRLDAEAQVMFVGGGSAFGRLIANLVQNAVEGDGRVGASRIVLATQDLPGEAVLCELTDDGPGFSAALLRAPLGACPSTKATGAGLALQTLAELVAASGGRLERANTAGAAGAVVQLRLSAATRSSRADAGGKKSCSSGSTTRGSA